MYSPDLVALRGIDNNLMKPSSMNTMDAGKSPVRAPTSFVLQTKQHKVERYYGEKSVFGNLMELMLIFVSNFHSNTPLVVDNI